MDTKILQMTLYEFMTAIGTLLGPIIGVLTAVYLVRADRRKEIKKETKRISLVRRSLLEAVRHLSKAIESQINGLKYYISEIQKDEANTYRFPVVVAIKPNRFKEFLQTDIYNILTKLETRQDDETHGIYNQFMTSIDTTEFLYNQLTQLRQDTISKHSLNLKAINEINNKMFHVVLAARSLPKTNGEKVNTDKALQLYQSQLKTQRKETETDFDYYRNNFVTPFVQNKDELTKSHLGLELFFMSVEGKNIAGDEQHLLDSTINLVEHTIKGLSETKNILDKTANKLDD
jgi:hypothetical protein